MIKGFKMKVNKGMEREYERRHNLLWPEMRQALKERSALNYSIFLDEETDVLYGYLEIEDEEKWNSGKDSEINRKWWDYMADVMEVNPDNSPVSHDLRKVFTM